MKEQDNLGKNNGKNELTNQPNSSNLEKEGDIFMAEGNNGGPEQTEPKKPEGAESSGTPPEGEAGPEGPFQSESQAKPQDQSSSEENNTPEAEKPEITDAGREVIARFYATGEPPLFTDDLVRVFRENGISEEIINRYSSHPEEALGQLVGRQIFSDQERFSGEPDLEGISEYFGRAGQSRKGTEELKRLVTDEAVIEQLTSSTPNFSNLEGLKNFMESYVQPNELFLGYFASFITNPDLTLKDKDGNKVKISPEAKKILFEWTVEKIIGLPEHGSEEAPYKIDSYTAISHLTTLKDLSVSRFREEPEFAKYIGYLIEIREMSHELRRNLTQGDAYKEFIKKGLKAHGLDFMYNSMSGVKDVVSLYETFTALKVAEKKEWLSEGDVADIDRQVRNAIVDLGTKGQLKKGGRALADWETERALAIGKTFFAGTQRFAMYSSLGKVPTQSSARAGSLPYEYIVRTIATVKTTSARYFTGSGSRRLQERMLNNLSPEGGAKPLFGISESAWLTNGLGALDVGSHGWRSQLMFFGDIKFEQEREEMTLLEYFDKINDELSHDPRYEGSYDPALGFDLSKNISEELRDELSRDPMYQGVDLSKKTIEDLIKDKFSGREDIRELVLGQRLYLSALIKHGPFNAELREQLYKKLAVMDPLSVATLRPEILEGLPQETWNSLKLKLAKATVVRLETEGTRYFDQNGRRVAQNMESLRAERREFEAMDEEYRMQSLNYLREEYGTAITEEERRVLTEVINRALGQSEYLAEANLPFSFIINDAPHIAWDKTGEGTGGLGDENLFRIMLSDQGNLTEGYGAINTLIENPTANTVKDFVTFVEKLALVYGRRLSQKKLEPFLIAWMEMASTDEKALWIGGLMRGLRLPTSEMERYFRNSRISMDEKDRSDFLEVLAQNGVISDDVSSGQSNLDILRKTLNADRYKTSLRAVRMILLLLGPVLGTEFLKLILPPEIMKNL